MIYYSWTAMAPEDRDALSDTGRDAPGGEGSGVPGPPVAMGITDDRARAMRAGEESLAYGQAVVVIIEAVRPAMAPRTLAPCYVRTGVGWVGRRTPAGEVAWDRFFPRGGPDAQPAPGRMGS